MNFWMLELDLEKAEEPEIKLPTSTNDPMNCTPPGSSVHGILQARILEWVLCSPPGDLPDPGIEPVSL